MNRIAQAFSTPLLQMTMLDYLIVVGSILAGFWGLAFALSYGNDSLKRRRAALANRRREGDALKSRRQSIEANLAFARMMVERHPEGGIGADPSYYPRRVAELELVLKELPE